MRNYKLYIFLLLALILSIGCNPVETNLRTIYEDYVYVSADSTQHGVEFRDSVWVSKNINKWTSAGMIFTNVENLVDGGERRIAVDRMIENGFEGNMVANFHPFVVPISWKLYDVGTFQRTYYNAAKDHFMVTEIAEVVEYDGYSFVTPLLSTIETDTEEDYLEILQNIFISGMYNFVTDYADSNIVNFIHLQYYSNLSYPLYDMTDTFDTTTDPLDLGYTYDQYSPTDDLGFHTNIDIWITRFYNTQLYGFDIDPPIRIIVSGKTGGRLRADTSLVETNDITGWVLLNITNFNKGGYTAFIPGVREAYYGGSASTPDKNFLLCAGFSESLTDLGQNEYIENILYSVDYGMYFTPGFGSVRFDQKQVDDWWYRGENNDINWANNQYTPEFTSVNDLPFNATDKSILSVETTIIDSRYIYDIDGNPKIALDVELEFNKPAPYKLLVKEDGEEYPDVNSIPFINNGTMFYSFIDTTSILPPIIPPSDTPSIDLSWTSGGGDIEFFRMERLYTGGAWASISETIPPNSTTFTDENSNINEIDYKVTAEGLYGGFSPPAQLSEPYMHYTKRLWIQTVSQDTTFVLTPPDKPEIITPDPDSDEGLPPGWKSGLYIPLPVHFSDEIDYLHKQEYLDIEIPIPSMLTAVFNADDPDSNIIDVSVISTSESLAWFQWKLGIDGTYEPTTPQWYSDPNHDSTYRQTMNDTISTLTTVENLTSDDVYVRVKVKNAIGATSDWLEAPFTFERRITPNLTGTFVFSNNSTAPVGPYDYTITVAAYAAAIDFWHETSSDVEWGDYSSGPAPLASYWERQNPGGLHFTPPNDTDRTYPFINLGLVSDTSDLKGGVVTSATLWIKFADEPLTNMNELFIWSCAGEHEYSIVLEEWLEHEYSNVSHKLSDHIGDVHWTVPIAVNEGDPLPRDLNWTEEPVYPENPMFGRYASFIVADLNLVEQGWYGFDVIDLVQDQLDRDKPFTYYLTFMSIAKNAIATFYDGYEAIQANRFYLEVETE